MSAHDDFLDMRSAYERYEKAYEAWGRAVDGGKFIDPKDPARGLTPPASEAVQLRMATRMQKALDDVKQAADEAKKGMIRRGWPAPGKKAKKGEMRFV